ncbi:DUF1768 domain-containing protein [Dysgonomonas sp. 521]|uniref:HAD hydrolase-like protein n=1 Tax=Dysgonomonas sp. 521 TaxID=2302932 RepID=UPI0013D56034|nr:HAD hydrolase-like protein [Dysgonomonas sp. 521]NDV96993.1 DUF1768 domain-containing protein [Dysgonomonas sp. 521]
MRIEFRIDEICRQKGITLKQVAEGVNIHPVSFTQLLSCKGNPTFDTLSKIASYLNVDVSELFRQSAPTIELNKWEIYDYQDVVTFRKLDDEYGALSNMSRQFGIKLFDIQFIASEILYMIAGFKDKSIQEELLKENNPTKAKRIFRHGDYLRKHWRKDWNKFNLEWMKFCIVQKYKQNPQWVDLLNSTKGKLILEDSTMQTGFTSSYWGAKDILKSKLIREERSYLKKNINLSKEEIEKQIEEIYPNLGNGYFQGVNTMGKLLTLLRDNNGKLDYKLPDDIYILGNKIPSTPSTIKGIIFDFDNTLIERNISEPSRLKRDWKSVFMSIPQFTLYGGLDKVFKYIRDSGIIVSIVSFCKSDLIEETCKHFNIPFDFIITQPQARKKDKTEGIKRALEKMNIHPNEVISFGDSDIDYRASKTNNIRFVGCLWDSKNKELLAKSGCDEFIETPVDIIKSINM